MPISFVASTATLKKWNGTQPLVAIDAISTEPWEIDEFDRLNRAGAPIIAVSSEDPADSPQGDALFGVSSSGDSFSPGRAPRGQRCLGKAAGLCLRARRPGHDRVLSRAHHVARRHAIDDPRRPDPGGCRQSADAAVWCFGFSFVSQGSLSIGFGNLSDNSRLLDIAVRPSRLSPLFTGENFRVIDHDRGVSVPSENGQGWGTPFSNSGSTERRPPDPDHAARFQNLIFFHEHLWP